MSEQNFFRQYFKTLWFKGLLAVVAVILLVLCGALLMQWYMKIAPEDAHVVSRPAAEAPEESAAPAEESEGAPAPQPVAEPPAPEPEPAPVVEVPAADPEGDLPPPEVGGFQFADVADKARRLAEGSYNDGDFQTPTFLHSLTAEQWDRIRFRQSSTLWQYDGLPFSVQFFHPGFIYDRMIRLNVLEAGQSTPIIFSSNMFDYGDAALAEQVRQVESETDFAGFRLFFPINRAGYDDEVLVFLGATYFRAVGKNAAYGLAARGLALNTALPAGEEFPYFREFWLEKPQPDDTELTVYALMDSPSMTGAFRFVVRPGTSTIMDVESTLFLRSGAFWPEKIGLAPLSSMFLFSESTRGSRGDYRPEVHNSDGLLYQDMYNNWTWNPLHASERLAVNAFPLENPRGFGLLQRDADFDHYQDIGARFERRSSLWVEPQKDWGPGALELIEIPSHEDIHDNILLFWKPDSFRSDAFASGAFASGENSDRSRAFAYRLYWMAPGVTPHALGRAVSTRMMRAQDESSVQFVVDFESTALNALPADTGLTSVIDIPPESYLMDRQLLKNPVTGGWRLLFRVHLPQREGMVQNILSVTEAPARLRFRALLKKGENLPDPLTEAWVFDLPL